MELTPSFGALLQHFRPVFTAPSFRRCVWIVTGDNLLSRQRGLGWFGAGLHHDPLS